MSNLIINNATIVTPVGNSPRRGNEMSRLAIIPHATVIVRDGIIEFVGPTKMPPLIAKMRAKSSMPKGVSYYPASSIHIPTSSSADTVPTNSAGE